MVRQAQEKSYCFFQILSLLVLSSKAKLSHPFIAEAVCCVHGLVAYGIEVVFMWVPSHVGLAGTGWQILLLNLLLIWLCLT